MPLPTAAHFTSNLHRQESTCRPVTRYCGFFIPVDNELLGNENTGGETRYFIPSRQASLAQGLAPCAVLHAGTVLLLRCVSQPCSAAGEFPLATQTTV